MDLDIQYTALQCCVLLYSSAVTSMVYTTAPSIPCAYHGHSMHPVLTMDTAFSTSIHPVVTMDTASSRAYYEHSIHPVCLPWTQHPSRAYYEHSIHIPCAYHGHRTGNPLLPRTQHSPPSSSIQFTGEFLWLCAFPMTTSVRTKTSIQMPTYPSSPFLPNRFLSFPFLQYIKYNDQSTFREWNTISTTHYG